MKQGMFFYAKICCQTYISLLYDVVFDIIFVKQITIKILLMKTKLLIIIAAALLMCCQAQAVKTYKVDNGKVVSVITKSDTTSKKKDKVYQVVDGVTFYQGSKGGVYYYRTSKKTGKPYKCYIKQ